MVVVISHNSLPHNTQNFGATMPASSVGSIRALTGYWTGSTNNVALSSSGGGTISPANASSVLTIGPFTVCTHACLNRVLYCVIRMHAVVALISLCSMRTQGDLYEIVVWKGVALAAGDWAYMNVSDKLSVYSNTRADHACALLRCPVVPLQRMFNLKYSIVCPQVPTNVNSTLSGTCSNAYQDATCFFTCTPPRVIAYGSSACVKYSCRTFQLLLS